ncbi:Cytochrome P450 3A6 [Ooceraea biroi]|uniref:Cytochrome P450 3A6 n=1 Tax=Ooceraea biroi TaxID=2015173 RepID=A0A026W8B6_OOCBI|nr:Cytochrome P450 3A6 [Ooceraea biroi]
MTELTHFVLLMLAMHPEIQDTLRKEISTLDNETINSSCLLRMRYLHMVIKETLRLFPIAPLMVRELTGDIKLGTLMVIESCTLPDGCYVMVPIYAIHRNPKYWDHPNEFIPERFAPENSLNHNRDAYLPFGSGIRSCPGQAYMFLCVGLIVVNLMRRFRFATTANMKDVDITHDILLRSPNIKLSLSHV